MFDELVKTVQSGSSVNSGIDGFISEPADKPPKLPFALGELPDQELMRYLVRFTRWADFFEVQAAIEDIRETEAKDKVSRLEDLWLLGHRPDKPQSGELTMLKAEMLNDVDIIAAREAHRIAYNRRKLMGVLFSHAERDAAVCSREITRRGGSFDNSRRRADRGAP